MIAITVSEATRPAAGLVAAMLKERGYAVRLFEADGIGGSTMERLIREKAVNGVLDLALNELIEQRAAVGPDRLTAAGLAGIPQVIGLGGLDAEPELLDALGKEIAEKASAARGPTRVLIPKTAAKVLAESLRNWIYPPSLAIECDDDYAALAVNELIRMMRVGDNSISR